MNKNVVLNVLLFLTLMVSNISHAQDNLPVLVGDYIVIRTGFIGDSII